MGKIDIQDILRDEDRQPYGELIHRPGITAEAAVKWLTERGYRISRRDVQAHLKATRNGDDQFLGMSEQAQRELLQKAIAQLSNAALASLTRYAVYLAAQAARSAQVSPTPSPARRRK